MYTNDYKRNIIIYWRQWYPDWNIPKGFQVHHIKPKCTFDNPQDPKIHHPSNLVALHPDDHVTIHKLRGDKRAARGGFLNMRDYKHSEQTKKKMSEAAKTRLPQSVETRKRRSKTMTGKIKSPEHIQKIVESRKGWKQSAESKKKISQSVSGSRNGMYGRKHKRESVEQQLATKNSPEWIIANTFTCPYCERSIFGKGAFARWHGDNCRHAD